MVPGRCSRRFCRLSREATYGGTGVDRWIPGSAATSTARASKETSTRLRVVGEAMECGTGLAPHRSLERGGGHRGMRTGHAHGGCAWHTRRRDARGSYAWAVRTQRARGLRAGIMLRDGVCGGCAARTAWGAGSSSRDDPYGAELSVKRLATSGVLQAHPPASSCALQDARP
jgi:hypothetical protein